MLHLLLEVGNLLFESRHTAFAHRGGLAICTIKLGQVASSAFFHLFHTGLQLPVGEVLVAVVDRLELAAVNSNDGLRKHIQVPAQDDKLPAHATDGGAVVFTEVGDGLEVRRQTASQPDQLKVALGLSLQATAGLQSIQITIEVDLEQRRRMIRGAARCLRLCPVKTQLA